MYAFPKVKRLRGELKRSEVRNQVKYQLTTREFVQQRGRTTYRIALEHILGMVECSDAEYLRHAKPLFGSTPDPFGKPYKIVTVLMHLVTEVGVIEQQGVSFYTRLSPGFAAHMENLLAESG